MPKGLILLGGVDWKDFAMRNFEQWNYNII